MNISKVCTFTVLNYSFFNTILRYIIAHPANTVTRIYHIVTASTTVLPLAHIRRRIGRSFPAC